MVNKVQNYEVVQLNLKIISNNKLYHLKFVDFESILKWIKRNNRKIILHIMKKIKIIFLAVLLTKLFVLMINLASQLSFTEEKMQSINLLKQFLEYDYCKKNKKHFNNNLAINAGYAINYLM